jgi:hypothetical protein
LPFAFPLLLPFAFALLLQQRKGKRQKQRQKAKAKQRKGKSKGSKAASLPFCKERQKKSCLFCPGKKGMQAAKQT